MVLGGSAHSVARSLDADREIQSAAVLCTYISSATLDDRSIFAGAAGR